LELGEEERGMEGQEEDVLLSRSGRNWTPRVRCRHYLLGWGCIGLFLSPGNTLRGISGCIPPLKVRVFRHGSFWEEFRKRINCLELANVHIFQIKPNSIASSIKPKFVNAFAIATASGSTSRSEGI
jgi:hypothetical protein